MVNAMIILGGLDQLDAKKNQNRQNREGLRSKHGTNHGPIKRITIA